MRPQRGRIGSAAYGARAGRIRAFALDVDGVLTDGTLLCTGEADLRRFHAHDGVALVLLAIAGIRTALVTGKASPGLRRRARELRCSRVYDGVTDKSAALDDFLRRERLSWDELAYMGDDLPDLPALRRAGLAIAPANAVVEVRRSAHLVCARQGGDGAVREAVERLLKGQGKWNSTCAGYLRPAASPSRR